MKDNRMIKRILPVLLAALVVFSSLGLGGLAPRVQAEETADDYSAISIAAGNLPENRTPYWESRLPAGISGFWDDQENSRYKYADFSWYDTSKTEYLIATPEQLAGLMILCNASGSITDSKGNTRAATQSYNKTVKIVSDLDMSTHYWKSIKNITLQSSAVIDGQNFTLSGLVMDDTKVSNTASGLIGTLTGTIQNVIMDQCYTRCKNTNGSFLVMGKDTGSEVSNISNCVVKNSDALLLNGIGRFGVLIAWTRGTIKGCISENVQVYNSGPRSDGADDFVQISLIAAVVDSNGSVIQNCSVQGGGIDLENNPDAAGNNTGRYFSAASIYCSLNKPPSTPVTGCESDATIRVTGFKGGSSGRYFKVGGLFAGIDTATTYSCFTGHIYVKNCEGGSLSTSSIGGVAGTIAKSVSNCYNSGEITIEDTKFGGTYDITQRVGGVVGNLTGDLTNCYSSGSLKGKGANSTNGYPGLVGTIPENKNITNCFYINATKGSGTTNASANNAINLAAIKDLSGTNIITQARQGDDTARVVLADAQQLKGLQNAGALGESFGVQIPAASAFVSDKPSAVQAIVNSDNSVGLKTSGGTGGAAAITAKLYLNQNELAYAQGADTRTFCGPVKSIEAPITLNLNVVYVGLDDKSPTSAIEDMTGFGLKAGITFGGVGVDKDNYTLKWFKSDNEQSSPPASSAVGTEVTGMTETWDDGTAGEVTWKKTADATAKFTTADAGWYKLKATSTAAGLSDYSFETGWQYLSVDDLMVFDEDSTMPDKIELSSQDRDIGNKTQLAVKIEIASGFTGSIKYGWYKVDGTTTMLISGTEKTAAITADAATHAITDTLTVGTAYTDALKGTYQLIVTSVTPDGQAEQTKDIRGPSSEITCYNAEIQNDYVQAGPGYEGTPGNTMTQSIITLSEDFAASMYDAYWIKGGVLDNSTNLSDYTQVRHATLTDQGDGTYKAIATFNMEKGYEGDNYQLVIYPTNTTRPYRTDTAMQFKGAGNCALKLYAINTITYDLADSYSTAEMVQNTSINSSPTVGMVNPAEGTLTYTKVTGPEAFSIDPETGAIICSADPTLIANGLYTYSVKVTDERFKNDAGATLSGPGMSKTVTISFQVTGSSDFPLSKNLYIYQTGYIFADTLPSDQTGIIPYTGIYNIKSNSGTAYDHNIIVVSGNHTDGSRIILNESMQTAGVPITVKTGATAQVGIPDGAKITLTNTDSGGKSLQSDGSLILTGGATGSGTLTAPGGIAGGGSLTIGAAGHKGLTVDTAANGITAANTTIESGYVTAGSITGTAKTTIKGGNVKAETIGTSGATIIDGGSIIGAVSGAKNSEGEEVYPVTLKLSNAPEGYANTAAAVTTQKIKADGTTDGSAKTWTASASANGALYVYLPNGGDNYTRFTATATPASGPPQTLSRKINADTDGSLAASLLAATYSVTLPQSVSSSETVAHGVTANITIGMDTTDGWLYEGRSIGLEISPGDSYKTIWGKYLLIKEGANSDAYKPEFWIQTPSGSALSKAGYFGTLTDKRNDLTGQLIVPADSSITEGTYQSQLNWKIIPNDPVVGGNQPSY